MARMRLVPLAALIAVLSACGVDTDTAPALAPATSVTVIPDTTVGPEDTISTETTASSSTPNAGDPGTLMSALSTLAVAEETNEDTYDRDLYPHWRVVDAPNPNGRCEARQAVLYAESTTLPNVDPFDGCTIIPGGGNWVSLYDGVETDQPADFDIDHVVPLAEAHRSGAHAWDEDRRVAYANDVTNPNTLIAVSAASNRSKGDSDPTEWLPGNDAALCTYVAMWIDVKATWGLTADPAEMDVLTGIARSCDAETSPEPTTATTTETDVLNGDLRIR